MREDWTESGFDFTWAVAMRGNGLRWKVRVMQGEVKLQAFDRSMKARIWLVVVGEVEEVSVMLGDEVRFCSEWFSVSW